MSAGSSAARSSNDSLYVVNENTITPWPNRNQDAGDDSSEESLPAIPPPPPVTRAQFEEWIRKEEVRLAIQASRECPSDHHPISCSCSHSKRSWADEASSASSCVSLQNVDFIPKAVSIQKVRCFLLQPLQPMRSSKSMPPRATHFMATYFNPQ